jgi:hypothetical protein
VEVEAPTPWPTAAAAEESGLRFDVLPADAEVLVNGQKVGTAGGLGGGGGLLAVPPGIYQVSIRYPGHVTWRAEVTVGERPERIQVSLAPSP